MDAKIFRVNYKSDFILTLTADAGWAIPFCIKFWSGSPLQAYYAGWDGETYTHCTYDPSEPTKLTVQFDDHHLPVGKLKYQIAYHFAVDDFPNGIEDEVTNQAVVTTVIDGDTYQVMIDINGETAPEIQFNLPAYANEQQRIENEQQRIDQESARVEEFADIITTANADHERAESDHNTAVNDHERADIDHGRVESDLAEVEEFTNSLGAYDISAAHATGSTLATYPDLATALGQNGSNIPEALRKGGMSVKFVLTYDDVYVQYRLMAQNFTTDISKWQGVDEEPTAGSANLATSGGVYDAVEKLAVETLGEMTIQMPVKANTPTPGQSGDFVFTVDVSGLGIKSGTKITIGFTSELIDNSGVNVYYNGTSAGTAGNGRGTLAVTLGADLETLTFKRSASGIIGTGIVLISLTSDSSMYKHFSDEINAANADIAAADAEIAKIENTSEIERVGEKTFSFSVANEKYYELPYIPKKGDVLIFTLTANASMRCQISGRSKTGTLWTSATLTGTTATYEKTIEDEDIDKLYLYTGSQNTATEVSVAIKNNHSSSKRLDAVEDRLTNAESDIRTLNTEIGVPIDIKMDGSNFILPVGTYNASINVPEGSSVRQNLYIYDSNNVRLAEYTIRSSNDFSIEVPAGAARMYFYLGSQDTTGGHGVTSFTKTNVSTVYVDPVNGDDTSTTTVKTIGQALKLNKKNIILKDGIYDENTLVMVSGVKIMAEHTGKAVFIPSSSIVLTSDGTLMSGSSKVYQVSVDAAIATEVNKWRYIYQFGVDDPQTAIDNDFRLPVHGDLDYRCDFAAIRHLASIEAVEAADYAAFYIDTANNVLYYSRPSAVSAENYLFVPSSTKLFGSTSGKTFELQGLRIYGLVLSLNGSINAKVTDCSVFACGGGGCVCFDSVTNLHLLRCEAARGETSYSATTGDGFNSHNSSANRSNFTLEDCWAHDNFNDGYSDHDASEGYIIRGVYEYNCINHGGGLTPAMGAKDVIEGAICQCNKDDGIRYTGDPSSNTTYESLIIKDVLIRNNANNGFATTTDTDGNAYVVCINVLSYDNGGYGFINAGNNTVTCLNCKAVGNHGGDAGYDFSGCENVDALGIDASPTYDSDNLVRSGGVFDSVISSGVFDLSAHTGDSYASISAALTAMNALPTAYKKGGMSIKYVQSSDNKYVQCRCIADEFSTDVEDWQEDASIERLERGDIIPKLAQNLESWEGREDLTVNSTWSEPVRTTAGDASIVSSKGGKIVSIVPRSDFYASALKATGFNLLRNAVQIGTTAKYYFLVPKLIFGTFGTADEPNGILFTNAQGEKMTPTVYFKKLSDGVPTSSSYGSACTYTTSNGYRFYTCSEIGYMVVDDVILASTCAHIAWSRRYDDYAAIDAAGDAGSSISLAAIFTALHAANQPALFITNVVRDFIEFTNTTAVWHRVCNKTTVSSWTNTEVPSEGGGASTYIHSATISGMKSGGVARIGSTMLTVEGTTVSFTDSNATAASADVVYELATQASGTVSITPTYSLEDWGLEYLEGATGTAEVTTQYCRNYPDSLAALAQFDFKDLSLVVGETLAELFYDIQGIKSNMKRYTELIDEYGYPMRMGQRVFALTDGAPTEIPMSLGLVRMDASTGHMWVSKSLTISTSDWKQVQ